jgi:hypothetical protein
MFSKRPKTSWALQAAEKLAFGIGFVGSDSVLKGHDFSRAERANKMNGALQAAENPAFGIGFVGFGFGFERARLQSCR